MFLGNLRGLPAVVRQMFYFFWPGCGGVVEFIFAIESLLQLSRRSRDMRLLDHCEVIAGNNADFKAARYDRTPGKTAVFVCAMR